MMRDVAAMIEAMGAGTMTEDEAFAVIDARMQRNLDRLKPLLGFGG